LREFIGFLSQDFLVHWADYNQSLSLVRIVFKNKFCFLKFDI
jgi:hypothetical protein